MLTIDWMGRQVYGPYIEISKRKGKEKPRRNVVVLYGSGRSARRKKMAYSRWLMECHLQRELTRYETVDHKDEDTLHDEISNYQIMSHGDNVRKSHCEPRMIEITCAGCGAKALKRERTVLSNQKYLGIKRNYCTRECAALHARD